MGTPWDAGTYDRSSEPQQAWASEVLARLKGIAQDATVLDVGCGTGRVTEALLALVPRGRVSAFDASGDMVALARDRHAHGYPSEVHSALKRDTRPRCATLQTTSRNHRLHINGRSQRGR